MTSLGVSGTALGALAPLVFLAGVLEAVAGGGGGLITVPSYFAVGLSPLLVLGTNKLASSIGTLTSSARFMKRHGVTYGELAVPIGAGLAGGALGSLLSQSLSAQGLRWAVILLLPAAAAFMFSHHDFGARDDSASLGTSALAWRAGLLAFGIGTYDGFFGPGTGIFLTLAFIHLCRYDLMGSSTRARTINLATNWGALATFLAGSRVQWRLGLLMAAASVAGNYAGSHISLKQGPRVIRPAIVLVCAGLFAKLLLDALHAL